MSKEDTTLPVKCLHCETDLVSPIVCDGCHTLYPVPKTADYFVVLGVERVFDIDQVKLRSSFRAISRNIHPDRFSGQSNEMVSMATRLSAEVNESYATLENPVRRANYMLELAGGPSAVEVRDVPGNLLVEVMMLREEIEEATDEKDQESLDRIRRSLADRREETLRKVADTADRLATVDNETKTEFRKLLNSLKYFDNLLADLASDPLPRDTAESK